MGVCLNKKYILFIWLLCFCGQINTDDNLKVFRQWPQLQYRFPNDTERQKVVDQGTLSIDFNLPIDVDVFYPSNKKTSKVFITIPRFLGKGPVTLGTVDDQGFITGYPSYAMNNNQGNNCDGLTSVFRVAVDKCDRLWVIDTGLIGEDQLCPPQLLAFDLNTDKLIRRFKIPESSRTPISLLLNPIVDIQESPLNCGDTFVYVADVTGFGVLVYDMANDFSWFITQRYFYPYPSQGVISVEGTSFDNMDGVLGMALTPYVEGEDRILYFHGLASVNEGYVSTNVLKNSSLISGGARRSSLSDYSSLIKILPGKRSTPSAAEAIDDNGILYFGQMTPASVYCWNTNTKFSRRNFYPVAINRTTLQFASGMKVVNGRSGQELWVVTNRFQNYATGTITNNTINFRILRANISDLIRDSPCLLSN